MEEHEVNQVILYFKSDNRRRPFNELREVELILALFGLFLGSVTSMVNHSAS